MASPAAATTSSSPTALADRDRGRPDESVLACADKEPREALACDASCGRAAPGMVKCCADERSTGADANTIGGMAGDVGMIN